MAAGKAPGAGGRAQRAAEKWKSRQQAAAGKASGRKVAAATKPKELKPAVLPTLISIRLILISYWTLYRVGPLGDGGPGRLPLAPCLRHGPADSHL